MIRILLISILFFYFSESGFGQVNNPFEIPNRLGKAIDNKIIDSIDLEVLDYSSDSTTPLADTVRQDVSVSRPSLTSNPFDVNHVPVRRSELKNNSVINSENAVKEDFEKPGQKSNLIVFGIAILSLLLVAIVASVKRSLFTKVFRSFTNDNMLKLTQREEGSGLNAGFILLYIVFALNAASLIYLLILQTNGIPRSIWLLILLVVVCVYFIRHISMFLLGIIFPVQRESSQYSFLIAIVNILLGIVLIPVNLIIAYGPEPLAVAMTYAAIGIISFAYIVRSIKGFLIGLVNYGSHLFHFFLYLCTFEIVPVLLIYRILGNISAT